MPRKHNRSSRGGRGGTGVKRGGFRGGYIGREANKYNKRGGHGRRKSPYNSQPFNKEYPELDDLDNPGFISVSHPEKSMNITAKRMRNKLHLQNEAFNTDKNREFTMNLPLRKRPVEFVKSSTYDSTQNLIEVLNQKDRKSPSEDLGGKSEVQEDNDDDDDDDDTDQEEIRNETMTESSECAPDEEFKGTSKTKLRIEKGSPKPMIHTVPDDQLFFVDHVGKLPDEVKVIEVDDSRIMKPFNSGCNTEFEPVLSIGHVHLSTRINENNETETTLPIAGKRLKNLKSFNADQSTYKVYDSGNDFYNLNQPKSEDLYKSYNVYSSRVIDNITNNHEDESDDGENVYDDLNEDFEEEVNFIAGLDTSDEEDDDTDTGNSNADHATSELQNLSIKEKGDKQKEPEYGFLPEDYETFDNSLVDIINVRYDTSPNQYHLKCFQMLGTYDFLWVDEDILTDFLLENGMPEHRLSAYYNYYRAQLTPEKIEEEDYDLPISDSSDEALKEEYERDLDSLDEEGLDDLIEFTQRYDGTKDMDIEPTQSLKTRGKGKKKELVLEHIADDDLRDRLADQYQTMRERKKQRKKNRESNTASEHAKSIDLSLKFPYTLHIKEIKNEFESFLQDSKRNSLTFPPMDPHGIKTLMKLAYLYNMKSRKFGQGLKAHAVIVKNKRTFRSLPDYHNIGLLLKQRPVFNRIDQKRSRSNIEGDNAKSSRRGKPSKAHVKEGDIVGAGAPEIASDNIGWRLLAKMGWSNGQGLGVKNIGIPEPVVAKVKKTKLGIR